MYVHMYIHGISEYNKCKMQGRFQDFFQRVAEMSLGGGENLPGGGEKIARYIPFLSAFFAFLHNITNLRPHFLIVDTCYKEIHKIYF